MRTVINPLILVGDPFDVKRYRWKVKQGLPSQRELPEAKTGRGHEALVTYGRIRLEN